MIQNGRNIKIMAGEESLFPMSGMIRIVLLIGLKAMVTSRVFKLTE